MEGLLNFKPILEGITLHATLDDFGQIYLTSIKNVLKLFHKEITCLQNDMKLAKSVKNIF